MCIGLTMMAFHDVLSAGQTGESRVPPGFGLWGAAQRKCNTWNIDPSDNHVFRHVFGHLDPDICSSSLDIDTNQIDNIRSIIRQRIHSTGMKPAMGQPYNNHGGLDEDTFD